MSEVIRIKKIRRMILERCFRVVERLKRAPKDEIKFNKGYFEALYVLDQELKEMEEGKK